MSPILSRGLGGGVGDQHRGQGKEHRTHNVVHKFVFATGAAEKTRQEHMLMHMVGGCPRVYPGFENPGEQLMPMAITVFW